MKTKKIIKKYGLENIRNKEEWLAPSGIWCFSIFDYIKNWLLKCYPYQQVKFYTYDELQKYKIDNSYVIGDNYFFENYIELAKTIFGKDCKFIFPEKIDPLICIDKKEKYAVCIAPRMSDDTPLEDRDWRTKKVFVKMTGCKCPKIIERRDEK